MDILNGLLYGFSIATQPGHLALVFAGCLLGTLVGAGVPLISALRVARESIGNQTLIDAVTDSIERVKKGDSLSASLGDCKALFPGSVIEMIGVAEESGRLDAELVRIAAVTDGDLDQRLRMAVSLAEPLLLFCMAAFIARFHRHVAAVFSIQDYIKKRQGGFR